MAKNVDLMETTNLYSAIKEALQAIAFGDQLTIDNKKINSVETFAILFPIYLNLYTKKVNEQLKSASNRKYTGRKPISINQKDLGKIKEAYFAKQITATESAKILGISRRTFYRIINSAKI